MAESQNIEYKESWRDEYLKWVCGFPALKSALIDQPKTPNRQGVGKDVGLEVGLAEMIMDLILEDSEIKMSEMAEKLEVTTRTIEREMKKLRESGHVIRVGGKRYGHWEAR